MDSPHHPLSNDALVNDIGAHDSEKNEEHPKEEMLAFPRGPMNASTLKREFPSKYGKKCENFTQNSLSRPFSRANSLF
jgi:hypothetical protein